MGQLEEEWKLSCDQDELSCLQFLQRRMMREFARQLKKPFAEPNASFLVNPELEVQLCRKRGLLLLGGIVCGLGGLEYFGGGGNIAPSAFLQRFMGAIRDKCCGDTDRYTTVSLNGRWDIVMKTLNGGSSDPTPDNPDAMEKMLSALSADGEKG